jgi:uncharacterized protein
MRHQFSKDEVRRFLVDRFLMRYKKHQKCNPVEFAHIRPLECVQMDTLRIVERNHHLVLHNRFDNFHPDMLNKISYENRQMIEAYYNALCYVPSEEYRFHKVKHEYIAKNWEQQKHRFAVEIKLVKREIKKHGPLPSTYFKSPDKVNWGFDTNLKRTTAALDYLWYSGVLMTEKRESGKRFYNFPERILPSHVETKTPGKKEYQDFMLMKHMRTYFLGDLRFHRFGNMNIKSPERKKLVEPYIKKGELIQLEIDGVKNGYIIRKDDLEILCESKSIKADSRMRFMAPLDNMLFNRNMIEDIFDFDYRWEVYSPKAKRKYGYYVMPILFGFDFIGRIDPKANRKSSTLIFNHVQIDDGVKITNKLITEFGRVARRMAKFAGVKNIEIVKTTPGSLKKMLII